jgi:GntR family transcriptional regulator, arabinose operon transcriptional repressor
MSKALKYQQVIDTLQSQITEGKYTLGKRIPTQNELTNHFKVSRPTIEKALEDLECRGFVQRRKGSGTFVVYDALRSNTKLKFAFISLRPPRGYDFESNFVQMLASNFFARAKRKGFDLLTDMSTANDIDELFRHARQSCEEMIDSGVDGVFMLPVDFAKDDEIINGTLAEIFDRADVPIVLLDRDVFQTPRRSGYDIVGINNRRSAFVLTDHLIKNGATDLYFVKCPLHSNVVSERVEGFNSAMEYNGLASRDKLICGYGEHERKTIEGLIKRRTGHVGFVCLNDQTASILMRDIVKMGFDVPSKVRIAGFDDLPTSSLLFSPLTTIRQPVEAIVDTAINVMENRLKDLSMPPREIYVAEELVVRQSCGSIAAEGEGG